jgi:hypothetical protein
MFTFSKQPGETIADIGIDFTTRFPSGATIVSHTVTCATEGIVVSSRVNGMQVLATLTGGEDGQRYKIEYSATGSNGSIRMAEIMLTIKEL